MNWINIEKEGLPKESGRYLVMKLWKFEIFNNDIKVRKVPGVSNYRKDKGWMIQLDDFVITHWMEIPELKDDL